ncbi:TLC domain-containing protein 3A isoform X1 [Euwallacea fornicatus]|uniref:TLC domain-containing protein 3A isoform X1 n=1 Tax=Euwallacea fornicatus TaxID=995702 RepID=UPI003390219B
MHKRTQLHTTNYFRKEAKRASIIYPLLLLAVAALFVPYFILRELEWEEHVSISKGFCLFASGLLFFPSLFLVLNNVQLHTQTGRKFVKSCKLCHSEVYDISNKCVSAVQALFCCFTGLTSVQYSCSRDVLRTSHYVSEAYAWFGAAYFFYDLWSMYTVWSAKFEQMSQPQMNGAQNKILLKAMRVTAYLSSNFLMVFHHVFIGCFGFLVITYLRGGLGDCFFGFVYLMEASTPFVSLRGILTKLGLKNSKWYVANGLAMLSTFFIFRVAMFPYVINLFAQAIQVDFFTAVKRLPRNCLISISLLLFPQIYWFLLMLKGATKLLFSKNGCDKLTNNNNLRKKTR